MGMSNSTVPRTIRLIKELKADIKASKKDRQPVNFLFELQGKTKGRYGIFHHSVSEKALVGFFEAHGKDEFQVTAYPSERGVEYVLGKSEAK